ncbi:MAG: glycosyltransferase, partial [Odoribacter sp.]|nr:glycosyltransferase [Odoribacter sp.]
LGTVPIAFDSYSALYDVVQHQRNGMIVRNGDIQEFVKMLTALMSSPQERSRLAANAREDCRQFAEGNMIQKWITFLTTSESTKQTPRKS